MGKLSDCQRNSIDGIEIGEKSVCYVVLKKQRINTFSRLPFAIQCNCNLYSVYVRLSNMRMNLHYSLNRLYNISFLALHTCSK